MSCTKHKIYLLAIYALLAIVFLVKNTSAYKLEIFVIEITAQGFLPQEIEIRRGQSVVFENLDTANHWPELRLKTKNNFDASPLKAVLPKENWSYGFEEEGFWELRDRNFPEFAGSVLVKEDSGYTPGRPEDKPSAAKSGAAPSFLKNIFQYFLTLFSKNKETENNLDPAKILKDETKLVAYIKKFGGGKAISQIDKLTSSAECHRVAHLAGKHAYKIFKNNAFQWHAFAFDSACNSGFFHGAMDELKSESGSVEGICDNSPVSLKCAHDVGHSLMAAGNYKLYDVLKKCEALSKKALDQEECFRGTFMENADGGINSEIGHGSKYLSEDPLYPCTEVPEKYKAACWQFTMGRFKILYGTNYEAMLIACERIPAPYNQPCFSSVGGTVALAYPKNHARIFELCSKKANNQKNNMCVMGVAQELISNPKTRKNALDFCDILENQTNQSNCQNTVLAFATRFLGENFEKFCGTLNRQQKTSCLNFKEPHYVFQQHNNE